MKLKEYIEQLKKDAERIENEDSPVFDKVSVAEARLLRDIIEDLEKIEELK